MEKTPNYTPEMIARMEEEAPLNLEKAKALAEEFGKNFRSIIAKAAREGIEYEAKQPTTKTGEPVEKKVDIVAEIADLVGENLTGLEKAPKRTLVTLRNRLSA